MILFNPQSSLYDLLVVSRHLPITLALELTSLSYSTRAARTPRRSSRKSILF